MIRYYEEAETVTIDGQTETMRVEEMGSIEAGVVTPIHTTGTTPQMAKGNLSCESYKWVYVQIILPAQS